MYYTTNGNRISWKTRSLNRRRRRDFNSTSQSGKKWSARWRGGGGRGGNRVAGRSIARRRETELRRRAYDGNARENRSGNEKEGRRRGGARARRTKELEEAEAERRLLFSCALFSARGRRCRYPSSSSSSPSSFSLPSTALSSLPLFLPFFLLLLTPFSQRAKLFLTPFDT